MPSLLSHLSVLPHLMYLTSGFFGCQFFKMSDLLHLVLPLSFYCLLYPLLFLFFSLVYKSAFFFLSWRNGILSNLHKVTHQWLIKGLTLRLLSSGEPRLMASLNCCPTFIPNPELFLLKSIYHDFFFCSRQSRSFLIKKALQLEKRTLIIPFSTRKIEIKWTDTFTLHYTFWRLKYEIWGMMPMF